jgi:hypothetical protein
MEMWEQDLYEGMLIYDGSLTSEQQVILESLKDSLSGVSSVNLYLEEADISEEKKRIRRLLGKNIPDHLPAILLWYPGEMGHAAPFWTGRLSLSVVENIRQSPKRKEIGDHLLRGVPIVWVLVKSGNREKDASAVGILEQELQTMTKDVLNDAYLQPHFSHVTGKSDLFPIVVLSASDDQDRSLLAPMLMNYYSGAGEIDGPVVFPVFGRGRALGILAGETLTGENIRDVITFLLNPCSCQIKMANPGFDLLIQADWYALLARYTETPIRPVMAGVMPDTVPDLEYENIIDLTGGDHGFFRTKILSTTGIITGVIIIGLVLASLIIVNKRR